MRIGNRAVANVRGDQDAARGVERESIRLHAYGDLEGIVLCTWRKHRDSVLTSIGREDESTYFRHERTCHSHEPRDRLNVSVLTNVDHVDRIIAGMRNVKPIRGWMNICMIEPTLGSILRELDVTE